MNRIKELRTEKGLTLKDFASSFNEFTKKDRDYIKSVSYATVSRWEKGINEPKILTWKALADFFGVSIGYIQGTSEVRDSFYNEDDPFNAWVNVTAVHQDKAGNAYFGKNFRAESTSFLRDIDARKFEYLCLSLNTSALFSPDEIKENANIISNIDDILTANTIRDTIGEVFKMSLKAYNGDKKAKDAMSSIEKVIHRDYLGIKDDDYS